MLFSSGNFSCHALFHSLCLMTPNKILPLQLPTVNTLLNCCKTYHWFFVDISTIWCNSYGCDEQYICLTVLYLLLVFAYAYNNIVYDSDGGLGHGRDSVTGFNAEGKKIIKCYWQQCNWLVQQGITKIREFIPQLCTKTSVLKENSKDISHTLPINMEWRINVSTYVNPKKIQWTWVSCARQQRCVTHNCEKFPAL